MTSAYAEWKAEVEQRAEDVATLIERGERDGWTEGLVYRLVRTMDHDGETLVCVKCGWLWVPVANRCMNPECRGFCTWGDSKGAEPTSWIKLPGGGYRPRMPGESKT